MPFLKNAERFVAYMVVNAVIISEITLPAYGLLKKNRLIAMNFCNGKKKALESALQVAEQGSRAKTAFLANMSHDFRTPMNAISGFADIALANLSDSACVEDCLRKIQISSGHLLDLVNDILDVSRIESGKLSLQANPMRLSEFMNATEDLFSNIAQKKGINLTVDYKGIKHDEIVADRMRLSQVVANLASNALKFTPRGGSVRIGLVERGRAPKGYGRYIFTVTDTGQGMSQEFLKEVFEPFARSESAFVEQIEGTGLGTTIVRSLVELMGGSINVQSEVGKGTHFVIIVPLELDTQQNNSISIPATSLSDSTSSALDEHMLFAGKRALIADDDELSREVLRRVLMRYGFEVSEVGDGDAAVQAMRSSVIGHYDVLLLDIRMPGKNGVDVAREVRSLDRADGRSVPIFAVTAEAYDDILSEITSAQMTGRITKPINVKQLVATLQEVLL